MRASWRKARALAAPDRRLLLEAAGLTLALHAALRVLPFTTVRRRLDQWAARGSASRSAQADEIDRVKWAVEAMGRRIPATTCLCEALAGYGMLRRRGHDARLRIGVRHGTVMALDAHAWVECDQTVVIGFTPLLTEYAVLS